MFEARIEGPYSFHVCKNACINDMDPVMSDNEIQCSGFNHRQGLSQYSQHCQLYQAEQLQHSESFFEANNRYSFYWEYCVQSNRSCYGEYAFTYLSDRYMDPREVREVIWTKTLEDCLGACLDAINYTCRSVSYNRTDGDCFLSQHNQLSKPALIKINNNPNYRIDYYENSCTNNSFTFDYECKDDGIQVKVISKYPYTGAMYGLHDFFTCRIEPKDDTKFEYFFPSPIISKNCSASIRYNGKDMVLEIVISTDGIEPLYFITSDDLTYQARCPLKDAKYLSENTDHILSIKNEATGDPKFSILTNATKQFHFPDISEDLSGQSSDTNHTVANDTTITTITTTPTIIIITTTTTATTTSAILAISLTSTLSTATSSTFITDVSTSTSATSATTTTTTTTSTTTTVEIATLESHRITEMKNSENKSITTGHSTSTRISTNSESEISNFIVGRSTAEISSSDRSSEKHESTKIPPINEIESIFLETSSSTVFTSSRIPRVLVPGSDITNTTFIDSSSKSITEAPSLTYGSTVSTLVPEYNTVMALSNVNIIKNYTSTLPTTSKFLAPVSLSETKQSSENTETKFSSLPLSSSVSTPLEAIAATVGVATDFTTATMIMKPKTTATTKTTTTTATATTKTTTTTTTTATLTPLEVTESTAITATETKKITDDNQIIATLEVPLSTIASQKIITDTSAQRTVENASKNVKVDIHSVNKSLSRINGATGRISPKDAVIFDIFHNGQPVEAVVVGSKITLSFIPYYAIPPIYMNIKGCQVEPVESLYEWEREPLAIIKDGCQADHVGLVCPPQKTEYGIRVMVESFRYQTTSQLQYSCLVRICPFAPCPVAKCEDVEGCGSSDLLSNTFGLRSKRHITIEDIRAALAANPDLQRQIRLMNQFGTQPQTTSETQQQLIELGGDHVVKKQLVVVNSEDELRYYVRTGDVP
uniref:ZP domain-containing protein n=1 Tax=Setaria digitata TaxID=48799 RepID=A0A915PTS6_9BILA